MPAVPSHLIDDLASDESVARAVAAEEIYRLGSAPALRIARSWMTIPELAALLNAPELSLIVGLAVYPETFEAVHGAFGGPKLSEVPPDQDALEFEMYLESGASLDILTTKDAKGAGAIARYLARFGQGIQQVEFPCSDVDAATNILQNKFGLSPVYPTARPGANNTRINFFLVTTDTSPRAEKILIELFEKSPSGPEAN